MRSLAWAIVLLALVSALFSLLSAYHEAGELQDELLHQTALALERHADAAQTPQPGLPALHSPPAHGKQNAADDEDGEGDDDADDAEEAQEAALIVQSLGSSTPLALPAGLGDGLHDIALQGKRYRVLLHHSVGAEGFAIAQRADFRQELALASAVRSTLPLLFLLPVMVLLISLRVRQAMQPVARLAQELHQRSAQELQALAPDTLPTELRPFVQATNALLQRVDTAMQNQVRFVADAAHELRTPLSALSLQSEALAADDLPAPVQARLAALQAGLARQAALVAQLLDLARVQAAAPLAAGAAAPVLLLGVVRQVVQDCLPLAQAKNIDLGVENRAAPDLALAVPEHALYALLKNLVDNALRYSQAGGRVDIRVWQAGASLHLAVADQGPGIAPPERQRVLQAFYRLAGQAEAGSGLGLAIVAGIADSWGASLHLDWADAQQQRGLLVELVLPDDVVC